MARRNTLPKSGKRRRTSSSRKPISKDDVVSWLESERLDRIAGYVHRGRRHSDLSNEALLESWKQAMRAMAESPREYDLLANEQDLNSEIELRGMTPPWDDVREEFEAFVSQVDAHRKKLEQDSRSLNARQRKD